MDVLICMTDYGDGNGYDHGKGTGEGNGYGYGNGDGDGTGYGHGYGDGYGDGIGRSSVVEWWAWWPSGRKEKQ